VKRPVIAGIFLGFITMCAVCAEAVAQEADATEEGAPPKEEKKEEPSMLKTLGSIGLAVMGLVMVGIPAAKTFSSSLSYQAARLQLTNMLRTTPNQAAHMAKAMQGTFAEGIAAALKMGAMAGSQDPAVIAQTTAPTYDGTCQGISAMLQGATSKAKLGVMAAVGGAGLGLSGGSLVAIPIIIAVLTLLAFLRLVMFKSELDSNIIKARLELLPEVNAAIASGRYVAPPMPGM
jgi:hypothetical protein